MALYNELDIRHKLGSRYNHGFDSAGSCDLYDILLEVIHNAELHGNKYSLGKATWIEYAFVEDEAKRQAVFTMAIRDEGNDFDYAHVRKAEEAAHGTTDSYNLYRQVAVEYADGRGIFKTLRYCSKVSWNDKGNEITVTKILARADLATSQTSPQKPL